MPRRNRERLFGRREREEPPRYRLREITPPGTARHLENLRERDHLIHQRSRSPRNERRRIRNSPERTNERLRYEAAMHEVLPRRSSRSKERDIRVRRSSPRIEIQPKFSVVESKFQDDRFSDRPSVQWTDPSQDIMSATLGYSAIQPLGQANIPVSEHVSEIPVIPEFNPESTKLDAVDWLRLLESTAAERGWKQDEMLYIMTSRLAGYARQWYLTTGISCKSWSELKDAFCKTFPAELDYHALLKKMIVRVKEENESLSTYFLHKVALLNACEIQGIKAVSCIIAGLPSSKMQQEARMQKCEDPDQLYIYLRSLNKEESAITGIKKGEALLKNDARVEKKDWKGKKECYFCGNTGHVVAKCRYIKKHKCSVCHQFGHECEPLKAEEKKSGLMNNQVMEGALSRVPVEPKYFTEAFINGTILKAYVDFESESITIKEESAIHLRLPVKKQFKVVRGFAGTPLSSVGYIDTTMCVDRAMASVRLSVVPDHIQSIPIVLGQVFTQQPDVITFKDSGKIRFYQRAGNGETNFDF